jgi:glycosyltransferase involved in cell wall biosynthesis
VDGGSTDGTLEEFGRLSAQYPHLRLLTGPDHGQSDAMNKGVKAAQGLVVGFLNVDDFYEEGAIAAALQILENQTSPTMVAANCKIVNLADGSISWNRPSRLSITDFLRGHQIPANSSAYFYHKEIHQIVGYYDVEDHFSMDLDFLLACSRKVHMIYVDAHWGNFVLRPSCKTFKDTGNARHRVRGVLDKHSVGFSPLERQYFLMRRVLKAIPARLAREFHAVFPAKAL